MAGELKGKTIALTGTLEQMKRAEAATLLESLGATVAKSLSKKVDVLLAGAKPGSKVDKARAMGVEVRDEAWLLALRDGGAVPEAGEAVTAAPIEGPLADWVARLETLAEALRGDPRIRMTFLLCDGIGEAALQRLEASWKVDAFEPAIRNLYRSANGLCLLWVSTHHPLYRRVEAHWRDTGFFLGAFGAGRAKPSELPTTHQVEGFAGFQWDGPGAPPDGSPPWGAIYLPPLEKVLGKSKGLIQTAYGSIPDDLEREVAGRSWKGESLERALRVFDYPSDYCPAAFVMQEGEAAPPVVLADDHSNWASGRYASFEAYMEHVLGTYGTTRARMDWFGGARNEPVGAPGTLSLDEVLPPSRELVPAEDGATFEVTVESVAGQADGGEDPRIAALAKMIPGHRVKHVAKVLGLAPYNRKNDEYIPEIVAATADPKAIDSKIARKLMGAAMQRGTTKGAYLEAFAVGVGGGGGGGGETVNLRVTACYDQSSSSAAEVDASFQSERVVKAWLAALGHPDPDGQWVACNLVSASGRKAREATVAVTLSGSSGLAAGASARTRVTPNGFVQLGPRLVQRIY